MSNTFQNYAGRYKLEYVTLKNLTKEIDITELISEVNIYSSIVDPSNVARIVVSDARNVLSNFPLKGGDYIEFKIGWTDVSHIYRFTVTSVEDIANLESQRDYIITAITDFAFRSNYEKISRHYLGTTSEIAFSVFEQHAGESYGIWSDSVGHQNIVVPNWSPLQTISWLAGRSRAVNDAVRFRFFQDSKQVFHFMPIENALDLYKDNPPLRYSLFKNVNRDARNGEELPNSAADMLSIDRLEYNNAFDLTQDLQSGVIAGRRLNTNYTYKTLDVLNYNYFDQFERRNYLNPQPTYFDGDFFPGKLDYDVSASRMADMIPGVNHTTDVSSIKRSTIEGATQGISIEVKGNQTVDIGQILEIEIPSPEPHSQNQRDKRDLNWSGKYYVVGKRDVFDRERHRIVMDLVKESLVAGAA